MAGGVRKLEQAVTELGFVGAHSYPHWFGISPADRRYYPFYWKCIELDVPVQIQVGQAFQTGLYNVGRPGRDRRDRGGAAGSQDRLHPHRLPVGSEMVSVAWKHPNVYIGADCWLPRDWAPELIQFVRGRGAGEGACGAPTTR